VDAGFECDKGSMTIAVIRGTIRIVPVICTHKYAEQCKGEEANVKNTIFRPLHAITCWIYETGRNTTQFTKMSNLYVIWSI
jgi:hypothetical protein